MNASFTIELVIRTHGLFFNRSTITKQIYLERELHTYLFQNFIMKMQTVVLKKYLHIQIKKIESEDAISELGIAYHIYTPNQRTTYTTNNSELNWPFPDKYSTNIGISVAFTFTNPSDFLKKLIEPSQDLINKDRNTEKTSSALIKNYSKNTTYEILYK